MKKHSIAIGLALLLGSGLAYSVHAQLATGNWGLYEAAAVPLQSTGKVSNWGFSYAYPQDIASLPAPERQTYTAMDSFILPPGYTLPSDKSATSNRTLFAEYEDDNVGDMTPVPFCHNPISITHAQELVSLLAAQGINASSIMSASREYVQMGNEYDAIINRLGYLSDGVTPDTYPNGGILHNYQPAYWGYCLDANYVSNYQTYLTNFTAFVNSHSYPSTVLQFGQIAYNGTVVNLLDATNTAALTSTASTVSTASSASTASSMAPSTSAATTASSYTVSVNYDKFTSESQQYGYTDVYDTTGTKSVAITLVQLPRGSSLTASQAISQLSALGYRPATLSEIYSLKQADPSVVNGTTVALGTSLGTTYGYPTGSGPGNAGLGHYVGPFSTSVYKFVAVKN